MADEDPRTFRRAVNGIPVRALRARVVEGPEAGLMVQPDAETLTIGTAQANDLVLSDRMVSRFHLEVRRRGPELLVRDNGSTNGTRIGPARIADGTAAVAPGTRVQIGETTIALEDSERFVLTGTGPESFGGMIGHSSALRTATSLLAKVAPTELSVLLFGESGTGKELAAAAIHHQSPRKDAPLVTLDCGAISPNLFASELFGHERGAFTGAERRHLGAFERAQGGTVFLDEIGELSSELQAALLGTLERRRIRRVGGTEEIPIDVRVISATHRDLRAAVNASSFRLDLYFRIAATSVSLPALRERPEDIPLLIRHWLAELGREAELDALFPPEQLRALAAHAWPGNVRELRNVVLGTLALGQAPELGPSPPSVSFAGRGTLLELPYGVAKKSLLDDFERAWLTRLLERTQGNVRAAAREGRIERNHLTELLRKHGIRG